MPASRRPAETKAARRLRRMRIVALVAAAAIVLSLLGGLAASVAHGATLADGTQDRFVLVGTGGLQSEDVSATATPEIWAALGGAAADGTSGTTPVAPGLDVVRSLRPAACPADGWLAVSAGQRAADDAVQPHCRTLAEPSGGRVPAWDAYTASVAGQHYDARLGALGDAVAAGGVSATSIGPGAAIALADRTGTVVGTHVDAPTSPDALGTAVTAALGTSRLVVVDVGQVQDAAGDRASQVAAVDARVGAVLRAVAASPDAATTNVLVASLADSGTTPHLQLALGAGPALSTHGDASGGGTILASPSTRQPGLVQATDVQTTVTAALGIADRVPEDAAIGSVIGTADAGTTGTARLDPLVDASRHASAVRPLVGPFYTLMIVLSVLLYLFVTLGLRVDARWLGGAGRWLRSHPDGVLAALVVAGVALASLPVSTTLANLVPWWRAGSPAWALAGVVVAFDAVLVLLALAVPRVLPGVPRPRPLLWPMGVVGGVTALVLAADVLTGATLQISGLMGTQPLVAGRFYGVNNTSFALLATACVMVAVALADPLVRAGRRRAAALVVAVVGVLATAVDGLPGVGADFGGPPGLVVGFTLLALLAAGVRLTWRRVLAVLVAAGLVVVGFALADWLRPADQRTHLGRFVDDVLHGRQSTVLVRKLGQNVSTLTNWLTLVVLGGVLVLVFVLGRPLRGALVRPAGGPLEWLTTDTPLSQLSADAPLLGPGIVAATTVLGLGFLANDSGILVPAVGILLGLPVLLAVYADWLRVRRAGAGAGPLPAPSAAGAAR